MLHRVGRHLRGLVPGWFTPENITITIVKTPSQLQTVGQIRREVYIREHRFLSDTDYPEVFLDSQDDHSLILLALVDGEPAGTLRMTMAKDGPLELAQYIDLQPFLPPGASLEDSYEINRFCVLPRFRKTFVSASLIFFAWKIVAVEGPWVLFVSAKQGRPLQMYTRFWLKQVSHAPLAYPFANEENTYFLLSNHYGRPGSLRRARTILEFELSFFIARHFLPYYRFLFRERGFTASSANRPS